MLRGVAIWAALLLGLAWPIVLAAHSPLLAWRDPVYIIAGLAGVAALAGMVAQPLLAVGSLPGLPRAASRRAHRGLGIALVLGTLVHVGGLWVTSPPDVVDALLFRSPTPFSTYGVFAMLGVFALAALALLRKRVPLALWRGLHTVTAVLVVGLSVAHTLLIEGTMGTASKLALCAAALAAILLAVWSLRSWTGLKRLRRARLP